MLRKSFFFFLFLFSGFTLFNPSASLFADEYLTITTYYPSPYGVYNQLTTTDATYLATSGGKVGIGTASPAEKLEVAGGIKVTGTPPSPPTVNTIYKNSFVKGWVTFNGMGGVTINDFFNVSGVVRNAAGDYTISWSTPFANGNYAVIITVGPPAGWVAQANGTIYPNTTPAAGSVRIITGNTINSAQADMSVISVVAIGAQ